MFRVIRHAGQSPHWAYAAGMSRLSCSFCILASRADLRRAAELRPDLYRTYVELERRIGHTLSPTRQPLPEVTGVSPATAACADSAMSLGGAPSPRRHGNASHGTAASSPAVQGVERRRRRGEGRALLLDPVDLRGIPWRDSADRTRWATPVFLPPTDDPGLWLINLEELPSAVPMVQAALYQLFLERKCGEYELPEGASLIACGNRDADRAVVHRMPTPLSNRLVHLEIRVDARDWCAWGAANGIAPEVLFFIELEPELLSQFDAQSKEHAFPSPRSWEFASNIVKNRNGLDAGVERALFRGTVGEAAAAEFTAFLKVWRELPHPRAVLDDPANADIPENASTLMALCGSLYRMASDVNLDAIVTYATRLRREVGESLVGACVRREPALQRSPAFIRWAAAKTQ